MSGGGGNGGGSTQYNWNDTMAPYWTSALAAGQQLSQTPYQAYQGGNPNALVAGITPDQQNAMQNIRLYGTDPTYGVQDPNGAQNAGINMETNTLNGNYLPGQANGNPYANAVNPYSGMSSQYFNDTLNNGLNDITRSYQLGTAADTTRMFNQAGAFGGSAYNNAVAGNQYSLGKQLQQYTSGMQNDQYNRSAQLTQQQAAMGNQDYENARQLQMQTIPYAQNEQNLALGREQAVMGVGDANRSYNQDILNANYNTYNQQKQYPYTQMDYLTGLLSRAQGGISPNSTTQQNGYSASPFSSLLGLGLAGASLYGG